MSVIVKKDKEVLYMENFLIVLNLESFNLEVIERGIELAEKMKGNCYISFYVREKDKFNLSYYYALSEMQVALDTHNIHKFNIITFNHEKQITADIKNRIFSLSITQLVLANEEENRLVKAIYGSYYNSLLKNIRNIDLHVVARKHKGLDSTGYEPGITSFLSKDSTGKEIVCFSKSFTDTNEGIFFKLESTDFNHGIFISFKDHKISLYEVVDNLATKTSLPLKTFLL